MYLGTATIYELLIAVGFERPIGVRQNLSGC